MLKNGWVRLTLVAWSVWVLWTMNQQEWTLSSVCSGYDVIPICYLWEFALPPFLAIGVWWVVRGFGKEAVASWISGNRLLVLIAAASTLYLAARLQQVERNVASVDTTVSNIESTVGNIDSQIDDLTRGR